MRALLSVDDKTGLIALARGLQELGWELVATDGTRAALAAEGVTSRSVEDVTGSPPLLDGRVKTLHPKIHAAILARRGNQTHMGELKAQAIEPIEQRTDLRMKTLEALDRRVSDRSGGEGMRPRGRRTDHIRPRDPVRPRAQLISREEGSLRDRSAREIRAVESPEM
jgi:hypothetical protein